MGVLLNTNHNFTFVFASTNKGKLLEVCQICAELNWQCLDPNTLIEEHGQVPNVIEGIESYHKNAYLKAKAFYDWCKIPTIADDTGLEVQCLNGLPGIKSARYASENSSMSQNKDKLLFDIKSSKDRKASFRSVLCFVSESNSTFEDAIFAEAILEGNIISSPLGSAGFGYDDLFEVKGHEPNTLSKLKENHFTDTHRSRSFYQLKDKLSKLF
jgi:XTP/dITP diphosphohydrolase